MVRDNVRDLLEISLKGRPKASLEALQTDFLHIAHYAGSKDVTSLVRTLIAMKGGDANRFALAYRNEMLEKGLSAATANRRLSSLRMIFRSARLVGLTTVNIEVPNVKVESYRDTKGPGRQRVNILLGHLKERGDAKAKRDLAITLLFFTLALRSGEVVGANVEDVSFEDKTIRILGKGKRQKVSLAVPDITVEALREWIEVLGESAGPLFVNFDRSAKYRTRLTRNGLYKVVRKYGQRLEFGVKLRPHGFRHTAITEAVKSAHESGINLPEVLQYSRHTSLNVLNIYVDRERDVQGKLAQLVSQKVVV